MDETKDTKGLSSETPGQASKGGEGNTSDTEARTYTEEEKRNAISNALAKAGRIATAIEKREATVKAREDAIKAEQEKRDAAELAEAQNDPDKLAVYQSKQAERQRTKKQDERDAAQDKREAEHEAEINAAREAQKEIVVWQVASAKGIDPERLKNLAEKFNLEGKEQIEELAEEIASGKPDATKKKITPDSLVTSGGKSSSEGKTSRQVFAEYFRDRNK